MGIGRRFPLANPRLITVGDDGFGDISNFSRAIVLRERGLTARETGLEASS
jgi:hypothetical protein